MITYLAKNEDTHKTVERFIDGVGVAFTDFLHRMTPGTTEQTDGSESEPDIATGEKVEPVIKTTRTRRVAKAKKVISEEKSVH